MWLCVICDCFCNYLLTLSNLGRIWTYIMTNVQLLFSSPSYVNASRIYSSMNKLQWPISCMCNQNLFTNWCTMYIMGMISIHIWDCTIKRSTYTIIATLTLGLRPRQRVVKLRVKRKTQESHHMLMGVQRVWGNVSQPHFGQVWGWSPTVGKSWDWSPPGLPKTQKTIWKTKTPRIGVFLV